MNKNNTLLTLPGAIVIAAALIAIAIIYVKKPVQQAVTPANTAQAIAQAQQISIPVVTAADHIFGNPNAPIKIVEYSDPSCPFCKMFHPIMKQVMTNYGPTGQVAWVYRHFPLDTPDQNGNILHKNAGHESQAMECAATLGGNDGFWAFVNRLYEVTPAVTSQSPDGLDQKQLPEIAKYAGINAVSFNECLTSGRFKDKVGQDYLGGINAGISGTPFSIIITPAGTKIPLPGLQTYATMKTAIDAIISSEKTK